MIYEFQSFSTFFSAYQDDEVVILKGGVQWNFDKKIFRFQRVSNQGPLDQQASASLELCIICLKDIYS